MDSGQQLRRKRIVLVNRDFQLRYTRAAVGVGVLSTMLTTVAILYPLYTFEILRIPKFLPLPILAAMVCAVLINIFFIGLMGLMITHRIAGPMYSLVRHLRRIGMQQYGAPMRLRDDDDMRFLVRNFNDMQESLVRITRQDLGLLKEVLSRLASAHEPPAGRQEVLASLEKLCQDMEKRLDKGADA